MYDDNMFGIRFLDNKPMNQLVHFLSRSSLFLCIEMSHREGDLKENWTENKTVDGKKQDDE